MRKKQARDQQRKEMALEEAKEDAEERLLLEKQLEEKSKFLAKQGKSPAKGAGAFEDD